MKLFESFLLKLKICGLSTELLENSFEALSSTLGALPFPHSQTFTHFASELRYSFLILHPHLLFVVVLSDSYAETLMKNAFLSV